MKNPLVFVAVFLASASMVMAQATSAPAGPTARDLFTKANEAARQLKVISYEAEFYGEGMVKDHLVKATGTVTAQRGEAGKDPSVHIKGHYTKPGTSEALPFAFATDGTTAWRIDEGKKVFSSGKFEDAKRTTEVGALFPPKYLSDDAYAPEMTADAVVDGTQTVDGVEFEIVRVNSRPPGAVIRYFFGKKDGLLHRVENVMSIRRAPNQEPETGKIVYSVKAVNTNVKPSPDLFKLSCPENYSIEPFVDYAAMAAQSANGLLPAGTPAPDFELKAADGRTVSLKSLRGKVVVLDFWASWCGPCKMAMPGMQALSKKFEGKQVAVFGVNCRERGPDGQKAALQYVKEKGYTYDQLLDGDRVASAYLVSGIPCFYMIAPDGKILYSASGLRQQMHEVMAELINETLSKTQKADGKPAAGAVPPSAAPGK